MPVFLSYLTPILSPLWLMGRSVFSLNCAWQRAARVAMSALERAARVAMSALERAEVTRLRQQCDCGEKRRLLCVYV